MVWARWHSRDLGISSPLSWRNSVWHPVPPAKTLAWPWHVPSRHPHQRHHGSPGPSPAATSRQLVQAWREMTAKHPAPQQLPPALGMGWELQPNERPCVRTMMGMSVKCLPQKSRPAVGWYLAASTCSCCPVLALLAPLGLGGGG